MSITIAARKAKGRKLQNWVAAQISKLLKVPWGKDKEIQGREMAQSGVDIKIYDYLLDKFGFSIECKWQETWSIPAWIRQAKENQLEDTDWLLVCKKNREDPVVILDARLFFRLFKRLLSKGHRNYKLIIKKKGSDEFEDSEKLS